MFLGNYRRVLWTNAAPECTKYQRQQAGGASWECVSAAELKKAWSEQQQS